MAKNCKPNKYVNPDYYSVVVVQTLQERDNIPCKLRQNGTIAIVVEEGYAQYQIQTREGIYSVCNNNAWTQIETVDKVFDGNNLIIINNEEHKEEYLQSPLTVVGQMIFYVPENKYYKYDGADFIDPFPNKLDKPTNAPLNGEVLKYYGGANVWSPDTSLTKAEKDGSNITDIITWRTALDVYNKSEVNFKFINNTSEYLTSIQQPTLTGNILTLKYVGENGTVQEQTVDLSNLATINVKIEDASYNTSTNIITLTDSTGATFNINLSEFSILTTTNAQGITTLTQEGVNKLVVSKVGQTGSYNDLLDKPTPFIEKDTLNDVVLRGNYSPKEITFMGSPTESSRDGAIGMKESTYSMYFGNMNPDHTGTYNQSYGHNALANLTTGEANNAFGHGALEKVTSGDANAAFGSSALNKLTTGTLNTSVGTSSIENLTTGNYNTATGAYALNKLTTGAYNNALGVSSMFELTTGTLNTALGASSMGNTKTGYKNVAVGFGASYGNVDGKFNTSIGYKASNGATTGSRNIYIGAFSGREIVGDNNVIIGVASGSLEKNISNKLIIHSNHTLTNYTNGSEAGQEGIVSTPQYSSLGSALITGDFVEKWVKFNGKFTINPSYLISDETYTKILVAKPDGTIGLKDSLNLNKGSALPTTGMSEGDIFFNTTDKKHYGYNGTVWNTLY